MRNKFRIPLFVIGLVCSAMLFSIASCSHAPEAPPKTVQITGNDKMHYDVTSFEVKPGQKVTVTLTNIGKTPKKAMAHDFTLLKQGTDVRRFLDEGSTHAAQDYIAPDFANAVIAHTKLLGPGESDTITFTAPYIAGDYVYLCDFPAHYAAGMHGIMTVKQ